MNNAHRLPHELSEDERLGGIVRPILAQMFTRHTQKINEWLTQRLSAFDFENKKAIDRVRQDLAFPQYIPEGPKILVGEDAPTKGLGTNGDNYFRTLSGNATELYAKISGSWVLQASFVSSTAHTVAEFHADGVLTAFDVGETYDAGTGKLYYRGRRYGSTEFDETATGFENFTPNGSPPNADPSTAEPEIIYEYQKTA